MELTGTNPWVDDVDMETSQGDEGPFTLQEAVSKRRRGRPKGSSTKKRRRSQSEPRMVGVRERTQTQLFSPSKNMKVSDEPHGKMVEKSPTELLPLDAPWVDIRGERVIIELHQLDQSLQQVPCGSCPLDGHLRLARDITTGKLTDTQTGLAHEFFMECDKCMLGHPLATSSKIETSEGVAGRKPFVVNRAAVTAGELCGVRRERQTKMLMMMGIKGIMKDKTWMVHADEVYLEVEYVHYNQIKENRRKVRAYMEKKGFTPDEHGRIAIVVSADGSWAIKGYTSNCGQASLIFSCEDFDRLVVAQDFRQKTCSTCDWYGKNKPSWVVPPHVCRKNYTDTSKSMEQDILISLVDDVAIYEHKTVDGTMEEKPMEERLVIEAVCADEDSSFWNRITQDGALKNQFAPRKLSDVNHLSNCLMRRLAGQKAKKMKNTSLLSNAVCQKFCTSFRWIVKQNTGDHQRAKAQLENMICHYFDDHTNCGDFPKLNEDGTPKEQWCRAQVAAENEAEEGDDHAGPTNFPRNKYLDKIVTVKRGKYEETIVDGATKKTLVGAEDYEINYFDDVKEVFKVFLTDQVIKAATSGYSSNVNESLHSVQVSMMNGKHTFKGQRGNYVMCMQAATLKHSLGMDYVLNLLPRCGVPVTLEMTRHFNRATKKAEAKKLYYKKIETKLIRKKRRMLKRKQSFEDRRNKPEDYRKGMALDALQEKDDDSADDEADSETEEPDGTGDLVQCLRCHKREATEENPMLFCCNQMTCGQAIHEECAGGWSYVVPPPKGDPNREESLKSWPCPECQYKSQMSEDPESELIAEPEELHAPPFRYPRTK